MVMNDSPRHIAILLPDLRGGGAERVNLDLAHEFTRRGHLVELVLMRAEGEFLAEASAAFTVVDLGVARSRSVPLALARYLRRRRPDALLAAMWPLSVMAVIGRLLSRRRCRLVLSEHNTLSSQYRCRGRLHLIALRASTAFAYRLADARVGVSRGVVEDLASLSMMPTDKFQVIYNPIPVHPAPAPELMAVADAMWGIPRGSRILSVGSFKKQKNHALLLRAFALLLTTIDARLMLVGQGEGEPALRGLAEELGLGDRIVFAGFQPDPTPFYRTADVFVLSSNYEGFGNVIVEALAAGTPVVSTDCPSGPAEILAGGNYGLLVPVEDAPSMTEAIRTVLASAYEPARLQGRAVDFSESQAGNQYLRLLMHLQGDGSKVPDV